MSNWAVDARPSFSYLEAHPDVLKRLYALRKEFREYYQGPLTLTVLGSQASLFLSTRLDIVIDYLRMADTDIAVVISADAFNDPELLDSLRKIILKIFGYKPGEYEVKNLENANGEPYCQIKGTGTVKVDITISTGMHAEPLHADDFRVSINIHGRLEVRYPNFLGAREARANRQFLINPLIFQNSWQPSMKKGASVNYGALFRTQHLNPRTTPMAVGSTLNYLVRTAVKSLYFGIYPHPYTLFFFAGLHNTPLQAFDGRERKDPLSQSTWNSLLEGMKDYFKGDHAMFSIAFGGLKAIVNQEIGIVPTLCVESLPRKLRSASISSDPSSSDDAGSLDTSGDSTALSESLSSLSISTAASDAAPPTPKAPSPA